MIIGLSHLFLLSIYHVLAAAAVADGGGGRVLPSAQDRSLRILAVGDSLTAGFIFRDGKYEFHPYTRKMMDLCKVCTIENIGVTGMLAAAMKARMESFFPSDKNIVIILAGTNDLLRRASGAAIGADVIELHETAKRLMRDGGTNRPYTVAITIPSTHTPSQETERLAANRIIRRYVSESSGSTLLLDMEDMWPVSSAADIERFNIFWSPDMTHFSVQGYERMGYELYEIIKYHLLSSSNPQ